MGSPIEVCDEDARLGEDGVMAALRSEFDGALITEVPLPRLGLPVGIIYELRQHEYWILAAIRVQRWISAYRRCDTKEELSAGLDDFASYVAPKGWDHMPYWQCRIFVGVDRCHLHHYPTIVENRELADWCMAGGEVGQRCGGRPVFLCECCVERWKPEPYLCTVCSDDLIRQDGGSDVMLCERCWGIFKPEPGKCPLC